jgi:hypothetical protein
MRDAVSTKEKTIMAFADGLRRDIAAAVGRMQSTLGGRKEIRHLVEYLWEGETVERMATGAYGRGQGLLVLTDRRLFFVRDGVVTKQTEDFPRPGDVGGVEFGSGDGHGHRFHWWGEERDQSGQQGGRPRARRTGPG